MKKALLWLHLICATAISVLAASSHAKPYTLNNAITQAQKQDPWITGSLKQQESLEAMSIEANTLPDPTVSLRLANLPVDTFDFAKEGMTQLNVGVSQLFPRGKTLSLKQERLKKLSRIQPHARENRKAQVAVIVAHLWLDAYRNEKTIQLIEKDRDLFEHLVDITQSSYITASGRTRQQDFVRSQLELTRLDDRLMRLRQQRDMYLAKLGEWLNDSAIFLSDISLSAQKNNGRRIELLIPKKLSALSAILSQHPKIKSIDWKIHAFKAGIQLAKQSYKPQWGLNASYGHRDQTPMGEDRSDFFSVGVTFDVPLFTGNRQDKKVQSAQAEFEAVKAERALALRQLKSGYESVEVMYLRLIERKSLFDSRLLKQMAEQVEASLSAYTSDDGDFAEVVRAHIAELNARIEALNVDIDRQKIIAQLNYFQFGINAPQESTASRFSSTRR